MEAGLPILIAGIGVIVAPAIADLMGRIGDARERGRLRREARAASQPKSNSRRTR